MSQPTSKPAAPGDAGKLFREGRLADAIAAANAAVRKAPTDIGARVLLAELLLFAGNVDRVDTVLDACADLDPTSAIVVAEFRQLLRGETARRQLFREGRVPEFLTQPPAHVQATLRAMVALRGGDVEVANCATARNYPTVTAAQPTVGYLPTPDPGQAYPAPDRTPASSVAYVAAWVLPA